MDNGKIWDLDLRRRRQPVVYFIFQVLSSIVDVIFNVGRSSNIPETRQYLIITELA